MKIEIKIAAKSIVYDLNDPLFESSVTVTLDSASTNPTRVVLELVAAAEKAIRDELKGS